MNSLKIMMIDQFSLPSKRHISLLLVLKRIQKIISIFTSQLLNIFWRKSAEIHLHQARKSFNKSFLWFVQWMLFLETLTFFCINFIPALKVASIIMIKWENPSHKILLIETIILFLKKEKMLWLKLFDLSVWQQ
jgi:hypothetical protein